MTEIDKQLERVQAEAALLVDAARYRWLATQKNISFELRGKVAPRVSVTAHRGSMDPTIDSLMAKEVQA